MRTNRRWTASVTALLGLALSCSTGCQTVMGGMTLPSGRYLEHYPQYFAPDPAFPLPRELASQECPAPAVKPGAVGTWCRVVGPKVCVLRVAPDHLTLTVCEAREEGGRTMTGSIVITADYHLTRDGLTAVGLITGVDVRVEGDLPDEDTRPLFDMVGELQKALEDKPLALTFRLYGDALVVGNVRMPAVSERMEVQPAVYLAGRYTAAGDKMLPKPRAVKCDPKPQPQPGYFPPPLPPSPYTGQGSDLLPPQAVPCPAGPRPVEFVVPAPRQRVIVEESWSQPMTAPVPPTIVMPQPTPPGVSANDEPKPAAASAKVSIPGFKKETYSSDPNIRMGQLLYQSEGPLPSQKERPRFWWQKNDAPAHLTPERIHGGIY